MAKASAAFYIEKQLIPMPIPPHFHNANRAPAFDAVVCVLLFTVVLVWVAPPERMLQWDEVDYIVAARQGLLANAFDATSLPLNHYLALAWAKAQGLPPPPLPSGYGEATDLFLLRHFHPPLLQYLGAIQALAPFRTIHLATSLAFGLRWFCGAALIVTAQITSNATFGRLHHPLSRCLQAAIVLNAAWLLSLAVQNHVLMAISLLLVVFCLTRSLQCQSRARLLLLSASLAFAILSLETSLVVVAVSFAIAGAHGLLRTRSQWRQTFQQAGLYILLLPYFISFLLWPASLTKLSLLRTTAMYAYRIFWVKEEYASVFSIAKLQGELTVLAPLVLIALTSLMLALSRVLGKPQAQSQTERWPLAVFSLIGVSYSVFMLPFLLNTTYIVPGLLLLCLPLPHLLESLSSAGMALQLGLISLVFASSLHSLKPHQQTAAAGYPGWSALPSLNGILQSPARGVQQPLTIYADGGHIFRFYIPDHASKIIDISRIDWARDPQETTRLITRKSLEYVELQADQLQRPAMLIVRERSAAALVNLPFHCQPTAVPGLQGGVACLVP
jgi:hypothetical protein